MAKEEVGGVGGGGGDMQLQEPQMNPVQTQ